MRRKSFVFLSAIVLIGSLLMAAEVLAWSFNGASVECDGFWKGNIDTNAQTECSVKGPLQPNGSYGNFSVMVWCANPNEPGNISPPKTTEVSFVAGSQSNQNGRREKGKVYLTVHINTDAAIDPSVCNQGGSNPNGQGQWVPVKVLPSSPFTGVVKTSQNNGGVVEEVYACGTPTLFADGTNMDAHVNQITQALQNGVPVSSLGLVYNCTLISSR